MTTWLPSKILAIAGVVSIAICAPPAFAKTVSLAPSTDWQVNNNGEKCQLFRSFGEGKDRTILYVMRYEPGDAFRLMLIGGHAQAWKRTNEITVQFGPSEAPFSTTARPGTSDRGPAVIFPHAMTIGPALDQNGDPIKDGEEDDGAELYKIGPQREGGIREVAFLSGLMDKVHLQTGSLAAPFAALRKCNEDLLAQWGIDLEKLPSLSKQATPIGSPGAWVNSTDYPPALVFKSGIVNFRLIVEPNGDVSACGIQDTLEPEEFAKVTCDVVKRRAKFEPALDADGKPVKSYWISAVQWQGAG